eukprot:scaffold57211_cov60-Phaeocystis_antarctica.AAC.2
MLARFASISLSSRSRSPSSHRVLASAWAATAAAWASARIAHPTRPTRAAPSAPARPTPAAAS